MVRPHLVAAVIRLRAEERERWRPPAGGCLRGWLYDELLGGREEGPGGLADAVHGWRRPGLAAAAVVPPWGPGWRSLGRPRPNELDLRVSAIEPLATGRLVEALVRLAAGQAVQLGAVNAQVVAVATTPDLHPLSGSAAPETLLSLAPAASWPLLFLTPTFFATGDVHLPLPMPRSMVGSWLGRWRDMVGVELGLSDDFLARLDRWLELREADIQTAAVAVKGDRMVTGFVGQAILRLAPGARRRLGEAELAIAQRALSTLHAFAFYASTGAETALGCGLTWPRLAAGR